MGNYCLVCIHTYRYIEFQSNKIKRVMEMDGSDGYTIM